MRMPSVLFGMVVLVVNVLVVLQGQGKGCMGCY